MEEELVTKAIQALEKVALYDPTLHYLKTDVHIVVGGLISAMGIMLTGLGLLWSRCNKLGEKLDLAHENEREFTARALPVMTTLSNLMERVERQLEGRRR